jgi:hypothetical protein
MGFRQKMFRRGRDIFVAAPRTIHHDDFVGGHFGRDFRNVRDGMRSFEGGNDAFCFRQQFEPGKCLLVGRKIVFYATDLAQVTVFRTNRGVIEPCGNGMRQLDLAILVRKQKCFRSLKNTQSSSLKSRCVFPGSNSLTPRFNSNHPDARVIQKWMEQANGIAAATDASDEQIGQKLFALEDLLPRFLADDALKIPHHHRIRMGTEGAA